MNGKDYVIGYGFAARGRVKMTKKQADHILMLDVIRLDKMLDGFSRKFNPNQKVALISLSFNLGGRDLTKMPKFKEMIENNEGKDYWLDQFSWANGKFYRGLLKRRKEECDYFFANN